MTRSRPRLPTPNQLLSMVIDDSQLRYLWFRATEWALYRITLGETPYLLDKRSTAFMADFERRRKQGVQDALEADRKGGSGNALKRYGGLLLWGYTDQSIERHVKAAQTKRTDACEVQTTERPGGMAYRSSFVEIVDNGRERFVLNAVSDLDLAGLRELYTRLGAVIDAIQADYQ